MNEIEKQILVNQLSIMRALRGTFNHDELEEREAFTLKLLNPPKQPTIAEKTEEFFGEEAVLPKEASE